MGIIYKGQLEEFITEIKTDSDFVSWYRIDKTCGDFNARTGNVCDLVENNVFNDFGSDIVTGGPSTIMKNHYERKNNDKQCNKYGPQLTDLCKTANVLIVNGRMPHYSSGNPTFKTYY